jgi:hypothetical protein
MLQASNRFAHAEGAMRMKASEVGNWLRQIAGKRDYRHIMPEDDYLVLRPGPHLDQFYPVLVQA